MQNNVTDSPLHPKSLLRSSGREPFLPGIKAEYTEQVRVTQDGDPGLREVPYSFEPYGSLTAESVV